MGDDIQRKRKELDFPGFFQGRSNRMVLQADFIKVIGGRSQRCVFTLALVADNLCKRAINNFFRLELFQRFNVVAGPEPLTCRHFVIVADKLFRHGNSVINDFQLIGAEALKFLHFNLFEIVRMAAFDKT